MRRPSSRATTSVPKRSGTESPAARAPRANSAAAASRPTPSTSCVSRSGIVAAAAPCGTFGGCSGGAGVGGGGGSVTVVVVAGSVVVCIGSVVVVVGSVVVCVGSVVVVGSGDGATGGGGGGGGGGGASSCFSSKTRFAS